MSAPFPPTMSLYTDIRDDLLALLKNYDMPTKFLRRVEFTTKHIDVTRLLRSEDGSEFTLDEAGKPIEETLRFMCTLDGVAPVLHPSVRSEALTFDGLE